MISYGSMLRRTGLLAVLAVAAVARLWHLNAGLPYAVGIDEPIVVDHALRILRTGDWNPHVFNYPTLVIYLQAGLDIGRFLFGAAAGEWSSLDGFNITAVYQAGRFVAALIGVAGVWLTYRLGVELGSRPVALLAAALMAVRPMHVRESHFVLTDVPMTALMTLAMWLMLCAGRRSTPRAYAWAGAACGLAAAAKYTGGVAFAGVAAVWVLYEWGSVDRGRKIAAAVAAAAAAFLIAAPYTVLDLPSFLDGFASLFSQFAGAPRSSDPAWALYAKHLWIDAPIEAALALVAVPIVLARGPARAWAAIIVLGTAYFYELSSHSHVFGRYVLPLLPILCLLASAAVVELVAAAGRLPAFSRPAARRAVMAVVVLALLYRPLASTVRWLDSYKRPDTRTITADWLKTSVPKGSRLAVENSGPTYLDAAGFTIVPADVLIDQSVAWYRERTDYLVISAGDLTRYADLLGAGPTVFQISPTPQRWGPPIRIVKLAN
jgi:4-amino-4-deoxy-L-arabinose transferase-like glycosyltransferase